VPGLNIVCVDKVGLQFHVYKHIARHFKTWITGTIPNPCYLLSDSVAPKTKQQSALAAVYNTFGTFNKGRANYGETVRGVGGHRSPYLPHAKRALYHLSYDPDMTQPRR